jgi:hypothetical protein
VKIGFLELSSDKQRLYFEQAAIQRNISPVIMEKDFWVCWLLSILFKSEFAKSLVFISSSRCRDGLLIGRQLFVIASCRKCLCGERA